ncbi:MULTISPECIES: MFS transporter [unclassified Achromobacter]|uniref:MFS transporter n=1 Tax=unclassified Achromobacter TaxID=2626865 RepID=UPI000B51CC46|nr:MULTISPECIES: MFS transporter [unclassified Achromobacter]OWT80287.1 MFS transporter [Achromobacter sp. HZ34]OWT82170.1 MFS transporter [Achromobacter sp. HZ28]
MRLSNRRSIILALGTTQTLAWASSYYLPAMLAASMANDLGVTTPTIFAAFSFALLVSALVGPSAGHAIDRWGGRPVLMVTNLIFAAGLASLAAAQGPLTLFLAWALLGIGMGSGLYEAAFAALVRLYGQDSRSAISGITLLAGFASTVGWPLSTYMELHWGWHGACLAWAGLHLILALPLNAMLPTPAQGGMRPVPAGSKAATTSASAPVEAPGTIWPSTLLAVVFAVTWFTSTAMAAHLPSVLMATGASLAAAVAAGALVGPAQVAARIAEFTLLRKTHPLLSAKLASLGHPIGAAVLLALGAPAASAFVLLHGAGNGILTIAKGTLPLAIFGTRGYGLRQGVLMVPARLAQASAPWLFGVCIDRWGAGALWVTVALGLCSFLALAMLRIPAERLHEGRVDAVR